MNKKLFILLGATLLLASCSGNGGSTTSGTSTPTTTGSSTTTGPKPGVNYGTAEAPLTVAQFQEEVEKDIGGIESTYSSARFYVKGINRTSIKYGTVKNFSDTVKVYDSMHLFDGEKVGTEEGLPVFRCIRASGSTITTESIFDGDEVVIHAYGEFYDGRYTLYPSNGGGAMDCEMLSYKVGSSKITFNSPEHCTVTGIEESYVNGTNAEITVTPESGYSVRNVFYKGVPVAETSGKYLLPVDGKAECNIVVVPNTLVEEDLPAGTYTLTVTKANSGLPLDTASSSALDVSYYLAEETSEHIYKPLVFKWSAGSGFNTAKYDEFTLKKGKTMTISAPNGKITDVSNDYYSSESAKVYAGASTAGTLLTGTDGGKEGTHAIKNYVVNDKDMTYSVGSSASYTQSWYKLTLTVVVE